MSIDINKKYTNKRGDVITKIIPFWNTLEGCVASATDVAIVGYDVYFEVGDVFKYKMRCDLNGKSLNVVDDKGNLKLGENDIQSNFDLIEMTGYYDGKLCNEVHLKSKEKNPDIENYVSEKVDWFSNFKKKKLMLNSYKGKWDNYTIQWLFEKLLIETAELYNAIVRYDNEEHFEKIINESADISNYTLMIADIINKKYGGKNEKRGS